MQDMKIKGLGYNLTVSVPNSIEEYDSMAKKAGAALESATKNVLYRSFLAEFRDAFTEKLAGQTGIARLTKPGKAKVTKDDKGVETREETEVWDETEGAYYNRVMATVAQNEGITVEAAEAKFSDLADTVAATLKFDPSEREPKEKGPRKVPQNCIKAATSLVDAGKGTAVAAKLSELLGRAVEATVDSIAAAIHEDQRRKSLTEQYS